MFQLCDFGYSLMSDVNDDDEALGLSPGTAPYIAPEVYAAKRGAADRLDLQGWQRADVYSLTMMLWGLFRAKATPSFFPKVDISGMTTQGKEKKLGELVEKGKRPYLESKDPDVEQGMRPLWGKLLAHATFPAGWSPKPAERPTAEEMWKFILELGGTLQGDGGSGDPSSLPSTSTLTTSKPRPPEVQSSKFGHGTERTGADGHSRWRVAVGQNMRGASQWEQVGS